MVVLNVDMIGVITGDVAFVVVVVMTVDTVVDGNGDVYVDVARIALV